MVRPQVNLHSLSISNKLVFCNAPTWRPIYAIVSFIVIEKPNTSRITSFDLMRGYFLVAITLNHLHYFPNGLDWLTFRGELFVSSAEGFFFISGILLGMVRGFKMKNSPMRDVVKLLLTRLFQLYLVYVVSTVAFTLVGWSFFMQNPGLKEGIMSAGTSFWTMAWEAASFQYLYGWLDYLRLYCMFFIFSPLAIWLLRRGWWWMVLLISTTVWYLTPELTWPENLFTQPYRWQIIFFTGLVVGYHWQDLRLWWLRLASRWRSLITSALLTLGFATLLLSVSITLNHHLTLPLVSDEISRLRQHIVPWMNKELLLAPRLIMFMLWFWASFWLFRKLEKPITRLFGWILLPLGRNSLFVYAISGIIIFFVKLAVPNGDIIHNLMVTLGTLAAVWLIVYCKKFIKR